MQIPETEILITAGGAEVLRRTVPPGEYVIGREAGCEIVVEVEGVSRRHALLTVNHNELFIEDAGSTNGTFVNDRQVTEPTKLWPSQKVKLGSATIELHRLKTGSTSDMSLAPAQAAMKRILPDEFLRDKKYDIGGVVAQGGMGAILNAKEATTERTVAMKVMLNTLSAEDLVRFVAEAKITAQLEHPSIVPVYELSVDEQEQVFYTMKFVKGVTLRKVLENLAANDAATVKQYPLPTLLTIFQKVCDAVAFAHSKRVLHRDLKPENIMLGDFGEVLVMDWGLSKILGQAVSTADVTMRSVIRRVDDPASASATMAGSIMGTPQYMSPEQAAGDVENHDARTDIYALGAILYHILALRPPLTGTDPHEVVARAREGKIDPLTAFKNRPIPESLAAVVKKAMALDKTRRYGGVKELQKDIVAYQNGFATGAEKAGLLKQLLLLVKRHKGVFATGFIAWMLITALAVWFVLNLRASEHRAVAALADLRKTAPVFYLQAKVDFEEGKFDDAIEKIGYAIQLDDTAADYHLFRANLRESSQDLAAAAEGYRRVLALRPADAAAQTNLALCEKLLGETGGAALQLDQQRQLLFALRDQKRLIEAAPLAALIDPSTDVARAAILSRLREARKQPTWRDHNVSALPDGTFKVLMAGLAPIDFSVLKGQPVSVLDIHDTGITDLSSLAGLSLKELILRGNKVSDLSPLRGMPLENLDLYMDPVADLSPLRGMKLHSLGMFRALVTDLSPLAGMPISDFKLNDCKGVTDLSPLRGAPLVSLDCSTSHVASVVPLAGSPLKSLDLYGTRVSDITPLGQCPALERIGIHGLPIHDFSPLAKMHLTYLDCSFTPITSIALLRGQPLRFLSLARSNVTDLSPLEGCTTLEEIVLPDTATDLSVLRKLPRLKFISTRSTGLSMGSIHPEQSAEQFWKEYDAKQAAGKK